MMKETLSDPEFNDGSKTLILACEQGEVEFDKTFLKQTHSVLVNIENKEQLTADYTEAQLRELEEENGVSYAPPRREEDQVCLSAVAEGEVLDALRRCQTDALSPLEALNLIYEWKRKLSQ